MDKVHINKLSVITCEPMNIILNLSNRSEGKVISLLKMHFSLRSNVIDFCFINELTLAAINSVGHE